MEQQRTDELIGVYRDGLLEDTLPFWTEHGPDRQCGGFFTGLDRDGTVIDTDKGVWQQCRAAWLFGELYNNLEPREEWLDLARLGIEFIDEHGFDPDDGRMWFHLTREGRPIRKRRYAFSESFAAVAYGEFARATGEDRYAEKARSCFHEFLDHHSRPGRMEPKFTDVRPRKGLAFPMIAIVTAQELRDSIGLESADGWIDRCIRIIEEDHVKPDIRCVMETVSPDGEILDHFDGRTLNPGHAIEGACFVMEEGRKREVDHLVELGTEMLDYMWERGWDDEHGGILYFRDVYEHPVQEYWHDMKFWWPQNEAITATLLAHLITGEEKYERWHRQIHDYAHEHFRDPEYGEWFGYLHRDGSLSVPLKGNLWKGPFHLPRMQLRCWQMLEGSREGAC